jgi:hypothetical protein
VLVLGLAAKAEHYSRCSTSVLTVLMVLATVMVVTVFNALCVQCCTVAVVLQNTVLHNAVLLRTQQQVQQQ